MFSIVPKTFDLLGRCLMPQFLRNMTLTQPTVCPAPGNFAPLETGNTHYVYKEPIDVPVEKRQELVVLLHGASVYSFIWDRFVTSFLSRGHPVLIFDFYGHGYSEHKSDAFKLSIDFFCRQMELLLEHLNISDSHGSFILIGHSMGGLVASNFTSRHKNMVSKLILINSAGIHVPKSVRNILPSSLRCLQEVFRKTTCLDRLVHFIGGLLSIHGEHTNLTHEELCRLADDLNEEEKPKDLIVQDKSYSLVNLSYERIKHIIPIDATRLAKSITFLYHAWIHQSFISNRANTLLDILRGCTLIDGDYSKVFSSIDVPTLIIWGEADTLLPKFMATDMRTFMPHAEVLYLNGDHAAFLQRPIQTFDAIVNFVEFSTLQSEQKV